MGMAANEYGNWLTNPELARLRREWIAAHREWIQLDMSHAALDVLTDDQRHTLRRYHDAEAAYFARSRALARGTSTAGPRAAPSHGPGSAGPAG